MAASASMSQRTCSSVGVPIPRSRSISSSTPQKCSNSSHHEGSDHSSRGFSMTGLHRIQHVCARSFTLPWFRQLRVRAGPSSTGISRAILSQALAVSYLSVSVFDNFSVSIVGKRIVPPTIMSGVGLSEEVISPYWVMHRSVAKR
jgi:hypothetical protein